MSEAQNVLNLLHKQLLKIGHTWINQETDNCQDTPNENKRRFKIFNDLAYAVNITLWYGTTLHVACNDNRFPTEDDYAIELNAAEGKTLGITIMLYEEAGNLSLSYGLYIKDTLEINTLPVEYKNYRKGYKLIEEVEAVLDRIRNALA